VYTAAAWVCQETTNTIEQQIYTFWLLWYILQLTLEGKQFNTEWAMNINLLSGWLALGMLRASMGVSAKI
jgi:hypothetical protein